MKTRAGFEEKFSELKDEMLKKDALLAKCMSTHPDLEKRVNEQEKHIQQLSTDASSYRVKYEESVKSVNDIQIEHARCKQEKSVLMEEYNAQHTKWVKEQESKAETVKALKNVEERYEAAKLDQIKYQGEIKRLENEMIKIGSERGLLKENAAKYEEYCETIRKEYENLKATDSAKTSELQRVRADLETARDELIRVRKELNSLEDKSKKEETIFTVGKPDEANNELKDKLLKAEEQNVQLQAFLKKAFERPDTLTEELKQAFSENPSESITMMLKDFKEKASVLSTNKEAPYMKGEKEKGLIDATYGKYVAAFEVYESYLIKYQEERLKNIDLEDRLAVMNKRVESSEPLLEAQKEAYDKLVIGYKQKMKDFDKKCQELEAAKQELADFKSMPLKAPNVQISGTEPTLQEQIKQLTLEKQNLLLKIAPYQADGGNKTKTTLEEELKKKETDNKEMAQKIQRLVESIDLYKKFCRQFSSFPGYPQESMEILAPATQMLSEGADTAKKTSGIDEHIKKLEVEVKTLVDQLKDKDIETRKLFEENNRLKEKAEYYSKWVDSLQNDVIATQIERLDETQKIKDVIRRNEDLQLRKAKEELKKQEAEIARLNTELKICGEKIKYLTAEKVKLRQENEKVDELYQGSQKMLVEMFSKQHALLSEALKVYKLEAGTHLNQILGQTSGCTNEEVLLLRMRVANYMSANDALKARSAEVAKREKQFEEFVATFEKEVAIPYSIEINYDEILHGKSNFEAILDAIKRKLSTIGSGLIGKSDSQIVEGLKSEIHRLKEVIAKQQSDYNVIISGQEQIIEDLQLHFKVFDENARKEIELAKAKNGSAEITQLREDCKKLTEDAEIKNRELNKAKVDLQAARDESKAKTRKIMELQQHIDRLANEAKTIPPPEKTFSSAHSKRKEEFMLRMKELKEKKVTLQKEIEASKEPETAEKSRSGLNEIQKSKRILLKAWANMLEADVGEQTKANEVIKKQSITCKLELAALKEMLEIKTKELAKAESNKPAEEKAATVINPIMKKAVELSKKAKRIISLKNAAIEDLTSQLKSMQDNISYSAAFENASQSKRKKMEE